MAAFALTTFVLSCANAGFLPVAATFVPLAFYYGGLAQFLAGMWEFRNKNTFGAAAFTSYGAFWLALAFLVFFERQLGGGIVGRAGRDALCLAGDHLEESVAEALRIGQEAGCRVQISHHKAAGKANWGQTRATLRMIAEARARGVEVDQDVYPYTASSTMLTATLPPSFLAGSEEDVLGRLQDPDRVSELKRSLAEGVEGWENHVANSGWDGILISTTADHRFEGMTVASL